MQRRNEKLVKILIKDFAHVPGFVNVAFSRTRSPKDNFIPTGEWPSTLDINLQRLNNFVIEAEIFERAVRLISLKTTVQHSINTGIFYGEKWTSNEFEILNYILIALMEDFSHTEFSIQKIIVKKFNQTYPVEILASILLKIDSTEAKIMKERLPYLTDAEFRRLDNHRKNKKKRTK